MSADVALAEWRRAQAGLGVATSCHRDGYHADAVSRAYYAVMHAAKAALEIHGIAANSHDGVRNRFGKDITMAGLVERHWGAEFRPLYDLRVRADYSAASVFGHADAQNAVQRAAAFLNQIRELLLTAIPAEHLL